MRIFIISIVLFMGLLISRTDVYATVDPANPHGPLSIACNSCHTTEGWSKLRPDLAFDHGTTDFPLVGRHNSVACISCHTSLVFAKVGGACRDCHLDIHRGQFAQNSCEECHTPAKWNNEEEMRTRHQKTRFPLIGVHASLDCQQCHANGQFVNVSVDCQGCHLPTYEHTTTPSHVAGGLPTDCEQCHSITSPKWAGATFNHTMTAAACIACHRPDYEGTTDPNHVTGHFSPTCTECHSGFTSWRPATFNHNASGFPLTGAHLATDCSQCHINGQFAGTPTACYDCHRAHYEGAADPNHVAGNYDHNCSQCHTTTAWAPATFDHNSTNFPLTGAHVAAACTQCHIGGQFNGTTTECYGCHQANFEGTTDPNHVTGNYDHNCALCHTTTAWAPATFDHSGTNFPLTGAHVSVNCALCHVNGQFQGTPTDCWSCHQADYNGVQDPNHVAGQYPHDCLVCHSTSSWAGSAFDHSNTGFPLTGAHVSVSCTQCHINGQYQGTPTDCWSCHQTDFNGVTDPNHVAGNYDHNCTQCHTTTAWAPATFDHSGTNFPLTGAHVSVNCALCHVNGQFQGTPTDCWSCHQADYNNAENHVSGQYPHDCLQCHNTNSWGDGGFDHSGTNFPLTGAHVSVTCTQCHVNGQFQGTPTDCWSCHQTDFEGVTDPNHVSGNYPHDCLVCHTTTGWDGSQFDHSNTNFPLTGAHVSVSCTQCHVNGQYQGTPTDCWSCHEADYNDAENHLSGQYPHDCTQCHTTDNWDSGGFSHNGTDFPLTGAHIGLACASCHASGQYNGLPSDCWSCHQANFEGVADPNHVSGNYDHVCSTCHTTNGWSPATFDHSGTDFPLTGAHLSVSCTQCHVNGQFQGTPTDCFFCHQNDYNGANNPNHIGAGFPTTCADCHGTSNWNSAWDHLQYFPIYSGRHAEEWNQCSDCHPNPNNFAQFTCITCHTPQDTDPDHDEVQGYVWESNACLTCHPTGEGGGLRHPRSAPKQN